MFRTYRGYSLLILFLWPCLSWSQKNVSLVGQFSFPEVEYNDVWAYVDEQGREYALLGTTAGVGIVDLSTPSQPQGLFFLPGIESSWRDLVTFGDYAYVSNESGDGIRIMTLSGLPDTVLYHDTILAGVTTAHNVWVEDGYLYVVGTNNYGGGMAIFDLNPDPLHPVFVGSYTDFYVHDVYVRGNFAYTAEISKGQLRVLDVSDKSALVVLGEKSYPGAFTHNTWLNDAGTVCFTTDEYEGAYLHAFDVADPGDIELLDRIRSSISQGEAIPHNLHVRDDYLFTSYYRDGLNIVDAHRPGNLVEVGYFDTSPLSGGGFNGAWGAYPFLPSGLVLVSDIEEGLFIVQPQLKRACYLEGNITDAETGFAVSQVKIRFLGEELIELSRTNGNYAMGQADSGLYTVEFSKYGYEDETLQVNLQHGEVLIRDLEMQGKARGPFTFTVLDEASQQALQGVQIEVQGPVEEAFFTYLTNENGQAIDQQLVLDDFVVTVGKWGYQTQQFPLRLLNNPIAERTIELKRGYYDDFVLDFGWQVEANAVRGNWERGEPKGTYETFFDWGIQNPEFDVVGDIGDQAYVTGNFGGAAFGDDVDDGYTRLISPPMDLGSYADPILQYDWWFVNWSLQNGGQAGDDFLSVSLTDGSETLEVARYLGPTDTSWQTASIRVREYFPDLSRPFQVMFYTQDLEKDNKDAVEAGIDFFRLTDGFLPTPGVLSVIAFPNPVEDQLTVLFNGPLPNPDAPFSVDLVDLTGRIYALPVIRQWQRGGQYQFPLSQRGLYVLRIYQEGTPIQQIKLLK